MHACMLTWLCIIQWHLLQCTLVKLWVNTTPAGNYAGQTFKDSLCSRREGNRSEKITTIQLYIFFLKQRESEKEREQKDERRRWLDFVVCSLSLSISSRGIIPHPLCQRSTCSIYHALISLISKFFCLVSCLGRQQLKSNSNNNKSKNILLAKSRCSNKNRDSKTHYMSPSDINVCSKPKV